MNELKPDSFNLSKLTKVENIIPGIKPPLPLEPKELYRAIRPFDASRYVVDGLYKSPKLREFFKPFAGQIVVEIGPGELLSGYEVAQLSFARAYIGVEPYEFFRTLLRVLEHSKKILGDSSPQIPRTAVQADALSFLKRLPDKSVSIFASQLESVMKMEYQIAVGKEIQRVLHPQGAFIEHDCKFRLDKDLFDYDLYDRKADQDCMMYWELEKYKLKS